MMPIDEMLPLLVVAVAGAVLLRWVIMRVPQLTLDHSARSLNTTREPGNNVSYSHGDAGPFDPMNPDNPTSISSGDPTNLWGMHDDNWGYSSDDDS